MLRFFQSFVNKMKAGFERIAKAARNDVTADDVRQDAWLVAHEIGKKRGHEIDFSNPEDQDLVMGSLYIRNVKRGDWKMRKAVRIDQERESEDGSLTLADRLPAQPSSDPLVSLLLRESSADAEKMLASSYSQAAAYVMVFVHFKNDRQAVCAYLVISTRILAKRVSMAAHTVQVQPSLFDRIERIKREFMPPPGQQYAARPEQQEKFGQLGWEF